jgi:hypothetical protein
MRHILRMLILLATGGLLIGSAVAGDESVDVTVSPTVTFAVFNVSASSGGVPNPATISFSNAQLLPGRALRISVRADSATLTPPGGAAIPVSNISWTCNGVNGTGFAGTVTSAGYTEVYQSDAGATSGSCSMAWSIAAPGASILAGYHFADLTWMFESVAP